MRRRWYFLGFVLLLGAGMIGCALWPAAGWSADQVTALRGLWLGSLQPLPPDPSNAVADEPRAAALGHQLFFDARLSANGAVSCATCHQPARNFNDGLPTKPIVSQHRGNGDYLAEGMKFQMPGWWYATFDIADGGKTDTVRFDFVLK